MEKMNQFAETSPDGSIEKALTGIRGLDEITDGGLPKGRPTLIAGAAGSGKTLLAMEFLVHGAQDYNEPGVFMAFEETTDELTKNVRSLGFDLNKLVGEKKLVIDYVYIERSEIEETGEYDLEGLFVRLGMAIDAIKAKRVVLDTIEVLFASLPNEAILRAELRRLFRWLKSKEVTAIITGERGKETITRHGLEEYVADCVIILDHRVTDQLSTRRLRVAKYRGTSHGTNEYPFLIGRTGIKVMPVTSLGLKHVASTERMSSGIPRLDAMLGGKGFYRGTTVLVSGTAGTGKSTLAATFAKATCERGERALYFAFEESESQILRNMNSIGMDLQPCIDSGALRIEASRPTIFGLEAHLMSIHDAVETFRPSMVVIDPVTNLALVGNEFEVRSMLTRIIDFLKTKQITALFTSLTTGGEAIEKTEIGISSLMDTWILVRDIENNGERNRGIMVLKSRGIRHSNQIREFLMTNHGIELQDVYLGPSGVFMGSARLAQENKEKIAEMESRNEVVRKRRELEHKHAAARAQIAAIEASIQADQDEMKKMEQQEQSRLQISEEQRERMAEKRQAD